MSSYKTVDTNVATGEVTVRDWTESEIIDRIARITPIQWENLRQQRNSLLAASDWTQVADAPVDDLAWAVYRQALRDLPQNTTDPFNPVWPVKPT